MNWIKVRLNKDNFWNMVFLAGTALGIMLSEWIMSFSGLNLLGLIMLVISLVFIPTFVITLNLVSCIDRKIFVSKDGRVINTKLLEPFILVPPVMAASIAWLPDFFVTIFSNDTVDFFILTTVFLSFFIVPVYFFILINCPISILFNKFLWFSSVNTTSSQRANFINLSPLYKPARNSNEYQERIKRSDRYISPSYAYLSYNIHNHRYRRTY